MIALAHLSDPHLGPLPDLRWRELASKRVLGYANWRRNRSALLGAETVRAVVDGLHDARPDHVAVTGDLVNLGLPAEIAGARHWLDSLGSPETVTVVPGNHDAYVAGAIAGFRAAWHPYMTGDDAAATVRYPFVRRRGPVGIVGVSTAIATAPFMATGLIRAAQATALAEALYDLGREGLFRVVLIHHPPVAGSTRWHRRLVGARLFRDAIATAGAELVLHGHNHRTHIASLPGPAGPVPVVGVTSASQVPREGRPGASYLLFRIGRSGNRFVCDLAERGLARAGGAVETIREMRLAGPGAQPSGTLTQA
jgi:3',5'-cyclic AMP phosphodiesterase CpdA